MWGQILYLLLVYRVLPVPDVMTMQFCNQIHYSDLFDVFIHSLYLHIFLASCLGQVSLDIALPECWRHQYWIVECLIITLTFMVTSPCNLLVRQAHPSESCQVLTLTLWIPGQTLISAISTASFIQNPSVLRRLGSFQLTHVSCDDHNAN